MSNIFKTAFLLTGMTLLLMLAGRGIRRPERDADSARFRRRPEFVSYFFSDKIALATYPRQPVGRDDLPRVYNIVERLAQKESLPDAQGLPHPNRFTQRASPPDAIRITPPSP